MALKRRTEYKGENMYYGFNHNGTLLGKYQTEKEAEIDTGLYTRETGNWSLVVPEADLDDEQKIEVNKGY